MSIRKIQKLLSNHLAQFLMTFIAIAAISLFLFASVSAGSSSKDLEGDSPLPNSSKYSFVFAGGFSKISASIPTPGHGTNGVTTIIMPSVGQAPDVDDNSYSAWGYNGNCSQDSDCTTIVEDLTGASSPTYNIEDFYIVGPDTNHNLELLIVYSPTDARYNIPTRRAYSVAIDKSQSTNGTPQWVNAKGNVVSPTTEASNLVFISPNAIYDKSTSTYYLNDGGSSSEDKFAPDYPPGNSPLDFIDDGASVYWPANGVDHSSNSANPCYGGIGVYTSGGSKYVEVTLVPTEPSSSSLECVFGGSNGVNAVSSYAETDSNAALADSGSTISVSGTDNIGQTRASSSNDTFFLQAIQSVNGSYSTQINLKPLTNANHVFSMFYWIDSSTLGEYGVNTDLNDVSPGDASSILSAIGVAGGGSTRSGSLEIFTTAACSSQQYYPFVLINFDGSSSISDNDVTNSNASGTLYAANSSDTGWAQDSWNGRDVSCLFNNNVEPANNYTEEQNNGTTGNGSSSKVYIGAIDDSTAATPPSDSNTHQVTAPSPTSTPPPQTQLCEPGGINLSWLLCPIINSIAAAEQDIETTISGLLKTPPVEFDNKQCNKTVGNCIYKAWSNIRTYGDILLVIGLLAAIIVEAIGGGVAEAYTVKRMLPRLVMAAILINLSIYLVAAMEDITNVLGQGLFNVIYDAFSDGAKWHLRPNGFSTDLLYGGGVVSAGLFALAAGEALAVFGLFVLLPALFAVISVLFTIIIRQGILILLLMLSPLAFALYCLPNTEKYFKKWWDLLFKTLMVYPVMMAIFAVGDIAYIIMNYLVNPSNPNAIPVISPIAGMLPLAALIAPLFLMPFAFKFSGGIIGDIHGALSNIGKKATEAIKGNPNDPLSLRNNVKRGLKNRYLTRGSDAQAYLRRRSKEGPSQFRHSASRGLATAALWAAPDLDKYRKDQNELFDREIMGKVQMGADSLERAFFARKWTGPDREIKDEFGNTIQTLRQGRYYSSYRGSDGKFGEHAAGTVLAAHRKYDGNESKIQTLIKYETGKVNNDGEFYGVDGDGNVIYESDEIGARIDKNRQPLGSFLGNLPDVMKESGLSYNSALGASTGSFFATQTQHKELKHTKLTQLPDGTWGWKQDKHAYVQDFAENVGSWTASNGKTAQIESLNAIANELMKKEAGELRDEEGTVLPWTDIDRRSKADLLKIGDIIDPRTRAGGMLPIQPEGEESAIPSSGGSAAPARVTIAMEKLADTTKLWKAASAPPRPPAPPTPLPPPGSEPYSY